VTYVASEVRRPERDLPRAMALGLAVVTACYVAVNLAYYYLLPMDAVRSSTLVAADAMSRVLPFGAALVSAAVVVSTYGALNGTTMSSARVHYALARDGLFFQAVGRVHPTRRTPHVSLTLQGAWSAALVFSGTFDQITDMLIFVSWAFYGLLALAVIVARVRFPGVPRPYRVPGYPWVPAAFVLFSAAYVVLSVMENTRNALFGTLLVAAGLPVWVFFARRRQTADPAG
jgi:APA family basic amino acid/polyamine antiporter